MVLFMLCRHTFFLFTLTSAEQNCVVKPAEGLEVGGLSHLSSRLHQTETFAKVLKKTQQYER
jgi:hypothetical protein